MPLTARERYQRCFDRRDLDRCPIWDSAWHSTSERWIREGMPRDVPFHHYFGLDQIASFGLDNSPRFPEELIEETAEYAIRRTAWGATLKCWKLHGGVPEFLDFRITSPQTWAEAKTRIDLADDRIPWAKLRELHAGWQAEGAWIEANLWFGFDVTHSWMVGTERILTALIEEPEWLVDMWTTQLETQLALLERVLAAGYTVDAIRWPDDMGYKGTQFFSMKTYRKLLKPVHRRAVEWAHAHGLKACRHSCGDIRPFVPELVEIGVDLLNPIEVKAGMDPQALKRDWGNRLVLNGGINASLFGQPELLAAEMERVVPILKVGGGYVVASDHSIPDSVSLAEFQRFVDQAKQLASY